MTDELEDAIIGDEDCVGDPEMPNFDITLNCEQLELSELIADAPIETNQYNQPQNSSDQSPVKGLTNVMNTMQSTSQPNLSRELIQCVRLSTKKTPSSHFKREKRQQAAAMMPVENMI